MPKKKKLTLKTLRYGIEIEVEYPNTEDSDKLIDKHRVIPGWQIYLDGSLENGSEYRPKKSNKLYFNKDGLDQIKEILGLINAHKGKARSKNSGFHVHIDATYLTNKEICNIVKAFIARQVLIKKSFKVKQNRLLHHCKLIPKEIKSKITPEIVFSIKEGTHYNLCDNMYYQDRYYMLNLQSLPIHGTIEFRFFNGTIKYEEIKRNIKWALKFCLHYKKGEHYGK